MFDDFGVENCKIVWIKDYPCNSSKELEAEEGKIQKENECVNKQVAGRTRDEYYNDTRETRLEYGRNHHQNNKEKLNQQRRERYNKNKHIEQEQNKERDKNKKDYYCRITYCECGSSFSRRGQSQHLKTLKHKQYLENHNNHQE